MPRASRKYGSASEDPDGSAVPECLQNVCARMLTRLTKDAARLHICTPGRIRDVVPGCSCNASDLESPTPARAGNIWLGASTNS